jgi:uncharacterized protein YndB with AHSA1/START domain
MAKNSKVVAKKATKSKVTKAPAKKKPAPKKVVTKKAPAKKVVKKVIKAVAKNKLVAKKIAKPAAQKKLVVKNAPAKKVVKKIIKPFAKNKVVAKVSNSSVTKVSKPLAKKVVKQAPVKPDVKKVEKVKALDKKIADNSAKVIAAVTKTTKTAEKQKPVKVETKSKGKLPTEEKVDPLHAKAAKAIKELEERMDLSKVRPRLQAGSPPPKPIRHKEPPLKLIEPTNTLKQKYSLEFEFRSSPKILFNSISDSSGLAGWFADEVHTKDDIYTFFWDQGSSQAKMVAMQEPRLIRFQWLEDTDGTYFQFEIKEDDITSDVALIITDFALKGERETQIRLWESQIQQLKMFVGSL